MKSDSERQQKRRNKINSDGLKEVRGILVKKDSHDEHKPLIKQYAKELDNESK